MLGVVLETKNKSRKYCQLFEGLIMEKLPDMRQGYGFSDFDNFQLRLLAAFDD